MMTYSSRIEAALRFAARAHRNQNRKGTDLPFVTHPFHVALILQRHGFDEDTMISGLLHDVIEDCGVDEQEIRVAFGDAVAQAVIEVTEPIKSVPWETRKQAYVDSLREAGTRALAVSAADKIHNLQSIAEDLRAGEPVWTRFSRGRGQTLQTYERVLDVLRARLKHPIVEELDSTLSSLMSLA